MAAVPAHASEAQQGHRLLAIGATMSWVLSSSSHSFENSSSTITRGKGAYRIFGGEDPNLATFQKHEHVHEHII